MSLLSVRRSVGGVLVLLLAACGGSTTGDESGGHGSGGAGGGGAGGSGGAPDCSDVGCTTDDCPEGTMEVVPPGECCKICEPLSCPAIPCPAIACGPGSESVMLPGQCCPSCEPIDCAGVTCADVDCASGAHPETLPGECCPTCVPGATDEELCRLGAENLMFTLRNNLGDAVFACSTDADCTIAILTSRCALDCGTAVNLAFVSEATEFAHAYGEDNCSTCLIPPSACPPVVLIPSCVDGECIPQ